MKKMIALLLALVLALSLIVTAFAAPTSRGGIECTTGGITIEPARDVINRGDYISATEAAVAAVSKTWNAQLAAARLGIDDADELVPVTIIDISGAEDNQEITLKVSLIAANGDRIVVLHYVEASHTWEKIFDDVVVNGEITIKSATYSPFLIMVESNSGSEGGVSGAVKHMLLNTISKISSEATQQPVLYSVAKTAAVTAGTVLVWQVIRYVVALAHMIG